MCRIGFRSQRALLTDLGQMELLEEVSDDEGKDFDIIPDVMEFRKYLMARLSGSTYDDSELKARAANLMTQSVANKPNNMLSEATLYSHLHNERTRRLDINEFKLNNMDFSLSGFLQERLPLNSSGEGGQLPTLRRERKPVESPHTRKPQLRTSMNFRTPVTSAKGPATDSAGASSVSSVLTSARRLVRTSVIDAILQASTDRVDNHRSIINFDRQMETLTSASVTGSPVPTHGRRTPLSLRTPGTVPRSVLRASQRLFEEVPNSDSEDEEREKQQKALNAYVHRLVWNDQCNTAGLCRPGWHLRPNRDAGEMGGNCSIRFHGLRTSDAYWCVDGPVHTDAFVDSEATHRSPRNRRSLCSPSPRSPRQRKRTGSLALGRYVVTNTN